MILAIDVHYKSGYAKCVGVLFKWNDDSYSKKIEVNVKDFADYEPGQFYKRELPCLLEVIEQCNLNEIEIIVVDGHVYTSEDCFGLGGHLFNKLDKQIPVIGVAKNGFSKNKNRVQELLRGESKKPLFISSIGIELSRAVNYIKNMSGTYRMPTILSQLDTITKED